MHDTTITKNKSAQITSTKYNIIDDIEIPEEFILNWQRTIDIMAETIQVPAGLIMRVHHKEIEVFIKSQNKENVYKQAEKADLDTGLYCETVMDTQKELLVPNALKDPSWDTNPDIELGMISYCGLPLTWPDEKIFGTICVLDLKENHYNELYRALMHQFREIIQLGLKSIFDNHKLQNKIEAGIAEIQLLNEELELTQSEVIMTMGAITEEHSYETSQHVRRVAESAYLLSKLCNLNNETCELIRKTAPLHDIGKVGIPNGILHKADPLSDEEWNLIKTHTSIGYKIFKSSKHNVLKTASIIAHEHHEQWDGKGYPNGLKGEDINIAGRIVAIADVFDALTHDRCYKKAWPVDEAILYIKDNSGTMFDPNLVEVFLNNIKQFKSIQAKYSG